MNNTTTNCDFSIQRGRETNRAILAHDCGFGRFAGGKRYEERHDHGGWEVDCVDRVAGLKQVCAPGKVFRSPG
jgi:hypothetical protein